MEGGLRVVRLEAKEIRYVFTIICMKYDEGVN